MIHEYYYDRGPWQLCIEEGCPNLFSDGCQGPSVCTRAIKRAQGIQIYVVLGDDAHYVTTQARKH